MPNETKAAAQAALDKLVEMVAETDESLMEEFFEKGTLPHDDLVKGLHDAVKAGKIFPVFPVSSARNVGIQPLLDDVVDLFPSPVERGLVPGLDPATKAEATREPTADAPFSAFVFKTIADPHAGRISLFRVYSGAFKSDSTVRNVNREADERVGALELLQGKLQVPVPEIQAGDLGAVAKLKDTHTGDTLADKAHPIVYPSLTYPEPATTFAIEPKTRGDEDKISVALHRLMEEDPVIRLAHDPQTHEILLSGVGQLHIEVIVGQAQEALQGRGEPQEAQDPLPRDDQGRLPKAMADTRSRPAGTASSRDCKIRVKPLPRGSGFKFVDDIFGGSIPKNYIPAVEKGIQESRLRGFVAGYPMVDFQVELFDGQYHDVDSSEMSFKIAGSLAYKDAVAKCRPTLLEPVMKVEIAVPEEYAGAVMGDLSSRRGRPQGMEPKGSMQVVKAEVPLSEMLSYDAELTSMTGGRGSYHMEMGHYDEVPGHQQEKVIAAAKAERGDVKEEEH